MDVDKIDGRAWKEVLKCDHNELITGTAVATTIRVFNQESLSKEEI